MRKIRTYMALAFILICSGAALAQDLQRYAPRGQERGTWGRFRENALGGSYSVPAAPAFEAEDRAALESAIVGGKLALTQADAVRFAVLNNLDITVERYTSYSAYWGIERSRAAFNPSHILSTSFNRLNSPNSNLLAGGLNLAQKTGLFDYTFRKPYMTGTDLEVNFSSRRLDTNSAFYLYNPSVVSNLSINFRQRLLRGWGREQNLVPLRIARNHVTIAERDFARRAMEIVAHVQDAYWDLVSARENRKVRRQSLDLAKVTLEHNRARAEAGTLAPLEVIQAEAEVATRLEQVIVADYGVKRLGDQLKTLISAREDTAIDAIDIEAVDALDPLPEVRIHAEEATRLALKHRPEMGALELEISNRRLEVDRAKNKLRPTLDLVVGYNQNGLGGDLIETYFAPDHPLGFARTGRIVPGGLKDSLGQLFRGRYLGYTVRMDLILPLGNSDARADVAQGLIAERQARTRIRALAQRVALEARDAWRQVQMNRERIETTRAAVRFAEKKLEGEELKHSIGTSTTRGVLEAQRDLVEARLLETRARVDFLKSKVALDRAMGLTLTNNGIEWAEALHAQ